MSILKKQRYSIIYLTITYLIPFIAQIAFFGVQVSKGIISIWNIVSVIMVIFLYVFAYKRVKEANLKIDETIAKNKENFDDVMKCYESKTTIKTRIIVLLVALAFGAFSGLFFNLYSSKTKGLEIVNSKVEGE